MRLTVPEAFTANLRSIVLFGLCVEILPASYKDSIFFSSLVSFMATQDFTPPKDSGSESHPGDP